MKKAVKSPELNERENMAIAGIISTQLLHDQFIENFPVKPISKIEPLKVCKGITIDWCNPGSIKQLVVG